MIGPKEEDNWYHSARIWTQSRHDGDPRWHQKLGWPHYGGDEWGRRVVTIGFGWVGYVSWAYRTCWKQCCHLMRQQTYDMEADRWEEHQEKLARGQCTCWSQLVWRHHRPPKNVPYILVPTHHCDCGHMYGKHDEYGDCQHVDTPTTP